MLQDGISRPGYCCLVPIQSDFSYGMTKKLNARVILISEEYKNA